MSRVLLGVIGSLWLVCGVLYIAMASVLLVLSPELRDEAGVSRDALLGMGILAIPLAAVMLTMVVRNRRTKLSERLLAGGIVALLFPVTLFLKSTTPGSGFVVPGLFALAVFGAGGSIIYALVVRLPRSPESETPGSM